MAGREGVRFLPRLTHAYKEGDIFKMSPGLSSEVVGGGDGLVEREVQLALNNGVTIRYGARAMSLLFDGHAVSGVRVKSENMIAEVEARASFSPAAASRPIPNGARVISARVGIS